MMKSYRYIKGIVLVLAMFVWSACSNEDSLMSGGDKEVSVTFQPKLKGDASTRAIGGATRINKLDVIVYEEDENGMLSEKISDTKNWVTAQKDGISLTLIEGHTYQILFWAYCGDNTAYDIEDGIISVDYSDYIDGGFAEMEKLDAFYAKEIVTIGNQKVEDRGTISLTRPLAQLNFADNTTQPVEGTHKAVVTFHSIPTSFNPFNGEVTTMTDAKNDADDVTFTFTVFPDEMLNSSYYYVSSNYLFAPTSIEATLEFQKVDGTLINKFEFKDDNAITLAQNMKTNVYGSIVEEPQTWSVWDGTIPLESTLTIDPENQNCYIIDEASDIAWLSKNGASLAAGTFLQTIDIDMNSKEISSIKLPAGSTYDGGECKIKNYSNSLFGDADGVSVQNLNIEEAAASGTSHVGVLMNTLKGSAKFTDITIANSSASTTNGAAGGMIGYVVRKSEKDRSEKLNVEFLGCQLNTITVSGSESEGKFVGLLSGYDNQESITFNAQCQASSVSVTDYTSVYTKANQSAWVTSDVTNKYDGWLGHETYRRGKVLFDNVRMAPRWDGTTKITPITDGTTKLIYSAFDLASLQGSDHTAVAFKENVDLGGDRATNKNPFTPISTIGTLDGENHKLYNLNIFYKNWIVGFINGTSGKTEHKNLHFVNSSVRANMTGNEAQVYVGTLCPYVQHEYIVDNITITNGYVLGLGKLGGLIGFVTSETAASLECSKCSVTSTTIENIESSAVDRFGNQYVYADFYPQGEVGGLIGFIGNDVVVTDCHVTNCNFNCYGQDMKTAAGVYAVPGRHVNRFIGDIRTINGDIIKITECTAESNSFGIRRDEDTQYDQFKLVGRCYYIEIGLNIPFFGKVGVFDTKGKLIVDETPYEPCKNNGSFKK